MYILINKHSYTYVYVYSSRYYNIITTISVKCANNIYKFLKYTKPNDLISISLYLRNNITIIIYFNL